jgi:hypothetical protein
MAMVVVGESTSRNSKLGACVSCAFSALTRSVVILAFQKSFHTQAKQQHGGNNDLVCVQCKPFHLKKLHKKIISFPLSLQCSIDNSEYMRNSDYVPTRFEAQHDAVNLVAGSKTQIHPENTVGILCMASNGKT